MMSKSLLIDLHFLPSLEYFCAIQDFNEIIIERHERFVKQTYRNRCYILTSQRIEMLTVPLTGRHAGILFRDVQIDNSKKWQQHMVRTIMSAYRGAPYYEFYSDDLIALLNNKYTFVYDLNMAALSFCLKSLRWTKTISETRAFGISNTGGFVDMRSFIDTRETASERNLYRPQPYYQIFGAEFSENLSLIDLIFCKGPAAGEILAASRAAV
jgi:hypothetical protein